MGLFSRRRDDREFTMVRVFAVEKLVRPVNV